MSIRFDEKGKFFTPIVSKKANPVILQTLLHRIEGNIYTREEERIKDMVNKADTFVALTDVVVYNTQDAKIYETNFILVNRDHIVWMFPVDKNDSVGQTKGTSNVSTL